jgi:hypothetical protein
VELFPLPAMRAQSQSPLARRGPAIVRQMLQRRSTKWGYGRWERLTAKDKVLDELIAKLEATTPLRFNSAPKRWRGKARSSAIAAGLPRAYDGQWSSVASISSHRSKPPNRAMRASCAPTNRELRPIWGARSTEALQRALDHVQINILAALDSNDPQQRLNAAKLMLRTKQARERGW